MSFAVLSKDPETGALAFTMPAPDLSPQEALQYAVYPESAVVKYPSDLPVGEDDFIPAWRLDTANNVYVDIPTARIMTKDRLRTERKPLLEALDVAFMKALETGASTAAIVAEKQRLRDITSLADACNTTAELRALKC